MRLPRLNVIFGLASPAVDILVKDTGVAELRFVTTKRVSGPPAPTDGRANAAGRGTWEWWEPAPEREMLPYRPRPSRVESAAAFKRLPQ